MRIVRKKYRFINKTCVNDRMRADFVNYAYVRISSLSKMEER